MSQPQEPPRRHITGHGLKEMTIVNELSMPGAPPTIEVTTIYPGLRFHAGDDATLVDGDERTFLKATTDTTDDWETHWVVQERG